MKDKDQNGFFSTALFDDIDQTAKDNDYFYAVMKDLEKRITFAGKDVLDIGCGTGIFLAPHAERFSTLVGIDGEEKILARALDNGYDDVAIVSDFSAALIPCNDASKDIVICKDVFEHLLDPRYLLREIFRVLKVDGTFLFHVPNHFPLNKRLRFIFDNNIDTFHFFPDCDSWNNPHIRFYRYRDIIRNFEEIGFRDHEDVSYHFPSFPLSLLKRHVPYAVKRLQMSFPDQFNEGYTIITRKV